MKYAHLLAAVGTLAFAAPAFADEGPAQNHDVTITVEGETPAKCNIAAEDTTVQLADYDLTNDQGRARGNVGNKVAQALTGLNMHAWCTGGSNGIVLSRTSLAHSTGATPTETGFARAVIYDVVVKIDGLTRTDRSDDLIEATEDGTTGPTVGRFGPTGQGAKLTFDTFDAPSTATTEGNNGQLSRTAYAPTNARLVAGDYSGTVTLTLSPGV